MVTPWGMSDYKEETGEGVTFYGTPSHGGYYVSAAMRKKMPVAFRRENGWYEEDCDWSMVALSFPAMFRPEIVELAGETCRNWLPDEYEAALGLTIPTEESYKKRERAFRKEHAEDLVTISARTSDRFPGFCEVGACRGGHKEDGQWPHEPIRFLVPTEEYEQRSDFGFIIDEGRHEHLSA